MRDSWMNINWDPYALKMGAWKGYNNIPRVEMQFPLKVSSVLLNVFNTFLYQSNKQI